MCSFHLKKPKTIPARITPTLKTKLFWLSERTITLMSAGVGFVLTLLVLAVLAGVVKQGGFLQQMFLPGGILNSIPWTITYFFMWSACVLLTRFLRLRDQRRQFGPSIAEKMGTLLKEGKGEEALRLASEQSHGSAMCQRLRVALGEWIRSNNLERVEHALQQQSDVDADTVSAGYAEVRLFVWAMPILGFIGTVIGISLAVGDFSSFLKGEITNLDAVKTQLMSVTHGLSFAFLTTLHGLLGALFVMLPASGLQKAEEDRLGDIDRTISQTFLPNLPAHVIVQAKEVTAPDFLVKFDEILEKHSPPSEAWRAEVGIFLQAVLKQLAEGCQQLSHQFCATAREGVSRLDEVTQDADHRLAAMVKDTTDQLAATQQQFSQETSSALNRLADDTVKLREALYGQSVQSQQLTGYVQSLAEQTRQLTTSIDEFQTSVRKLEVNEPLIHTLEIISTTLNMLRPMLDRLTRPMELRLVTPAE